MSREEALMSLVDEVKVMFDESGIFPQAAYYETDPFISSFTIPWEGKQYTIDVTDIEWAEEDA